MPYVVRDPQGRIASLHRDEVPDSEFLAPDHPEVGAFVEGVQNAEQANFVRMDAGLVRVLEDLIDALIRRNVLRITDLPVDAQAKLFDRKHFRSGVRTNSLSLYGTPERLVLHPEGDSPSAGQDSTPTNWPDLV